MLHVHLVSDAQLAKIKTWIKQNCNMRKDFSDVESEFLFRELLSILEVGTRHKVEDK
jgi:hypothetical protein